MATILPFQLTFDKDIPENFGNFEYRQERLLLLEIDEMIVKSHLEDPVIAYFLDMACANKKARVLGTGKSPRLTTQERDEALAMGVLAMRMSVLRKRLKLSLRGFSNFLSHSDLYKWFCGINRFSLPKVPGKSTIGRLENLLPTSLMKAVTRIRKFHLLCRMPFKPCDFISKMNALCMAMTFAKRKKGAKKIVKQFFAE